ncbi:SMI1/KNR4 family protein [Jeotgalibacillus sp. ET6]|uniref:SMI1/KNR4 family protein n=1 Tax=Jeotgalibacillus sp. ET6 TaxID=3037260 RepID=UPI0024183293|nr:SMI1/KNR4 family protein [Jeotgalibacillus sp. ET6]MDG5471380.1 SMI1/KNR4 family protein [Jeotgalibacillus sp. ET6]
MCCFFLSSQEVIRINRQDVKILITSQESEFFFTGGVPEELIHEIEKELNVQLPESYRWFLGSYGYGGINGVLIQGVGLDTSLQVVNTTKSLRKYGLPQDLVVIENVDEYVICLNTTQMQNNDCPVIDWDQASGLGKKQYENLYHYLYDRFNDAIENL